MADFKRLGLILLTSCAGAALAACDGASSIGSPGDGVIVTPPETPTPTPGETPTPTPTPGTGPAAECPAGTSNQGVITTQVGDLRDCRLPSSILEDLSIEKLPGVIYSISGRTVIGNDVGGGGANADGVRATLNIGPGVIVYAVDGPTFLIAERGSQLVAAGEADQPIIFTSRDNVQGNQTDADRGEWGGIILLGRAPISDCRGAVPGGSADCENLIEGPGADALYGGNEASDSSGTIRYVQIRYTGQGSGGNEIQGLTLGGVGSGTTIEYVQSHNSGDDGVEVFGGTVNMRNIILTGADDDTFDTDVGYKGAVQFLLGIQAPDSDDTMIEADSNAVNDALPRQDTRLANFTFIHHAGNANAILLRGGTDYSLLNGVVVSDGTGTTCLDVDNPETVQAADDTLDENGPPVIRSVLFSCPGGSSNSDSDDYEATALARSGNDNNIVTGYTPSLTSLFVNGTAETNGVAVADLRDIDAGGSTFFQQVDYVGAVSGPDDTWYRGWSCDASYADFGSGALCTAIPE